MNTSFKVRIFKLVYVPNFTLNWHDNLNFLDQLCPKMVLSVENGKSNHGHSIPRIRIGLETKYWAEGNNLDIFGPYLPPKCISGINRKSEHNR